MLYPEQRSMPVHQPRMELRLQQRLRPLEFESSGPRADSGSSHSLRKSSQGVYTLDGKLSIQCATPSQLFRHRISTATRRRYRQVPVHTSASTLSLASQAPAAAGISRRAGLDGASSHHRLPTTYRSTVWLSARTGRYVPLERTDCCLPSRIGL